jgi:DNA polymerase-3 subunit alpha
MREKYQDRIELQLDIDTSSVTEEELQQMAHLFTENQGETNIQFNVMSPEAKRPFAMHSRKFVIDPTEELLNELKSLIGEDAVALKKTNGSS